VGRFTCLIVVGLFLSWGAVASSEAKTIGAMFSGNMLLERCQGSSSEIVLCRAYLAGVVDGISHNKAVQSGSANDNAREHGDVCFPPQVTLGQITRVWIKWVQENPERLHKTA